MKKFKSKFILSFPTFQKFIFGSKNIIYMGVDSEPVQSDTQKMERVEDEQWEEIMNKSRTIELKLENYILNTMFGNQGGRVIKEFKLGRDKLSFNEREVENARNLSNEIVKAREDVIDVEKKSSATRREKALKYAILAEKVTAGVDFLKNTSQDQKKSEKKVDMVASPKETDEEKGEKERIERVTERLNYLVTLKLYDAIIHFLNLNEKARTSGVLTTVVNDYMYDMWKALSQDERNNFETHGKLISKNVNTNEGMKIIDIEPNPFKISIR